MDVPAGWHQDPGGPPGQLRWWDGRRWTEHLTAPPPTHPTHPAHPTPTTADSTPASWPVVVAIVALCTVIALGALVAVAGDDPARSADEPGPVQVAPADEETAGEEITEAAAQPSERVTPDRASRPSKTPKPTSMTESPTTSTQARTYLVTRVVDGDTIGLGNGETVRLVGIDTPETGDCGSLKAAQHLSDLVLWKRVRLTVSDEDRDGYGRLLRYVDVGSVDAGLSLIRGGLAIARYDSRDSYGFHPREPRYVAADQASPPVQCAQPQPLVGVGDGCASGYSPCIPAFPPDLDCADVGGPLVVTGADPHGLDADGDGRACE